MFFQVSAPLGEILLPGGQKQHQMPNLEADTKPDYIVKYGLASA
jgi:hypothetical protein